jgi:acyl transferase domain-containing protein
MDNATGDDIAAMSPEERKRIIAERAREMARLDEAYRNELILAAENVHDARLVLRHGMKQRALAAQYRKGRKPDGRA